jgi:hypothetical protein
MTIASTVATRGHPAMSVRVEHWAGDLKDAPLWRYMKLSTFLLSLEGKGILPVGGNAAAG